MKPDPVKLRREECLLWCHKVREHEWRVREHQKMAGFLCPRLFRQCESKLACHQLPKAEKLKWLSGTCLVQTASVSLKLA